MALDISSILIGSFVGAFMGLTGAGGAILAIPLLVFFTTLDFHQASAISLISICISSIITTSIELNKKNVRYKAATLLAMAGAIFAPLGSELAKQLNQIWLDGLFVVLLAYISIHTFRSINTTYSLNQANTETPCQLNPSTSKIFWSASCTKSMLFSGSIAGFLSGLLGIGGGFVVVPSLHKITALDHRKIVATTIAMTAIVSFVSFLSKSSYTKIDSSVATMFTVSMIISSRLSSNILKDIDKDLVRKLFAITAMCLAMAIAKKLLHIILP